MAYEKIYLRVVCEFSVKGGMRPLWIVWSDDSVYAIDRVKFIERKPCNSGGVLPKRYTVVMRGQQKYLYYEQKNERWFVEREV